VGEEEDAQRLYILDSNGVPLGYILMGGDILYSMDDKRVGKVAEDMTIGELKMLLLKGRTKYIV
jgi:hypothetical protein